MTVWIVEDTVDWVGTFTIEICATQELAQQILADLIAGRGGHDVGLSIRPYDVCQSFEQYKEDPPSV